MTADPARRARQRGSPVTVVLILLLLVPVALVARLAFPDHGPGCDNPPEGDLATEAELATALEGCGYASAADTSVDRLPCPDRRVGIVDVAASMPLASAIDVAFNAMPPRASESMTFVVVDGGVVLRGSLDGSDVSLYVFNGSGTAWTPGGMQRCAG